MAKSTSKKNPSCCQVEAIVSFDERGQLVIPKDVRKKFNLNAGEKLALISCNSGDELCCFTLMRTSSMQGLVKSMLGPIFNEIL